MNSKRFDVGICLRNHFGTLISMKTFKHSGSPFPHEADCFDFGLFVASERMVKVEVRKVHGCSEYANEFGDLLDKGRSILNIGHNFKVNFIRRQVNRFSILRIYKS